MSDKEEKKRSLRITGRYLQTALGLHAEANRDVPMPAELLEWAFLKETDALIDSPEFDVNLLIAGLSYTIYTLATWGDIDMNLMIKSMIAVGEGESS